MTAKEFFESQLITDSSSVIDKYAHIFNRSQLIRFAEAYHDSEVKKLNIPAVSNNESTFCNLFEKKCMSDICSVTPRTGECEYLRKLNT